MTNEVKNGRIKRVKQHKALGTWFDESGDYGINIQKRKEKLQYMVSTTRREASPKNVGAYSIDARMKLAEVVVILSTLYNAEGFHEYKTDEIQELERAQHKILTGILEIPSTTPYYALLMETGWWTMRARLSYKKLMLYHNIVTSDDKRVVKNMLEVQRESKRVTTWYASVKRDMCKYKIELEPVVTMKSRWKNHIKLKITETMEIEIREQCKKMTKARNIKNDEYRKKEYLSIADFNDSKKILKARMHMSKLPGNYKGTGDGVCTLCQEGKGNLEHYFRCRNTRQLVNIWDVDENDLGSLNLDRMRAVANFIEKIELLVAM